MLKYLLRPEVIFDDWICIILILAISGLALDKALLECEPEENIYHVRAVTPEREPEMDDKHILFKRQLAY